jgi:4-alpha-glucanotransferase
MPKPAKHPSKSASKAAPPTIHQRAAGWLLHPTSLPGRFGCGDIGPAAHAFIATCKSAGVSWWQMLPISPPDPYPGNSPYNSSSAFSSSALLISPELLHQDGLLSKADLQNADLTAAPVNFRAARKLRHTLLKRAFNHFINKSGQQSPAFARFSQSQSHWLADYCVFSAIKSHHAGQAWWTWPKSLAFRDPSALQAVQSQLAEHIAFEGFCQFIFDQQWKQLKHTANSAGIGLIGDLPIFISHDSADVWANPHLFQLDKHGMPTVISGYPADDFAPKGQRWGHPHYRWPSHAKDNYAWWVARFSRTLELFDAVRIDHFLGFYQAWAVPASAPDAIKGKWVHTPGREIFTAVQKALGQKFPTGAPIIAEDLGRETPGAYKLRDDFAFPGMRVLQFGFGGGHYHLPYTYVPNCVAYTGTHDNETSAGFYKRVTTSKAKPQKREAANMAALGITPTDPAWDMLRLLFASTANIAICPIQDVLSQDNRYRMNIPGTTDNNWRYRMTQPLPPSLIQKFHALLTATNRTLS